MKNDTRKLVGIILIALGSMFLLNRLGLWTFDLFFKGWWTLLLIIPAIYLIVKNGVQIGNVVLLLLGVFLFLDERGWNLSQYMLPIVLVGLGFAVLLKKR
jgi:hypothetical protein